MPPLGSISRRKLIHYFKELGFEGPMSGGNHQYMVKGKLKIFIPNPHGNADIGIDLLKKILQQAGIDRKEWEKL